MLSSSDLKRLNVGASSATKYVTVGALAFAAVVFGAGAVAHVVLALKFADLAQMSLWDIATLKPNLAQQYSGAFVRADECLSLAAWEAIYGFIFMSLAFGVRARAAFYERLRAEFNAKDA